MPLQTEISILYNIPNDTVCFSLYRGFATL